MAEIHKEEVAEGVTHVSIPEAELTILCGCPADSVKHLMKRGLITTVDRGGVTFETGPNVILLSDLLIQNGRFTNLCEFPILQMFYRQGSIIPGHPSNTGTKPVLVGSRRQVTAQLEYALRGNYGLVSEEELIAAGVAPAQAAEMMRLKLKFAFGAIRSMEEYLDLVVLENEPKEIRNGVFVKRLKVNEFEITHGTDSVRVDLNLPRSAQSPPPYQLGFHQLKRDYFAVVHSGEGDGWDPNRPAMASILLFQGKVYLIDAGPNIMHTLNALGISVNEIEGIFHTHAHDDHFCGLPDLMRADHRIRYYATPMVRASVMKKLAALSMMSENEFSHYFEFHDLAPGQWNDIDAMEVKPVFSPHPVETTIMFFRTLDRTGYRTYAHLADIASLKLLRGMITRDDAEPGLSQAAYDAVAASYLAPVEIKKLDIGGGMIHGDAEDFAADKSGKIILAHTALPLTNRQKEIGSGAPFGTVDVLIPSHQDYVRSYAFHYLADFFPSVPAPRLRVLLNNPIALFNPESIIFRAGQRADCVYLLLTGQVEMIQTKRQVYSTLGSGAMLGELTALNDKPIAETYRAANFVQALRIPLDLYAAFVKNNELLEPLQNEMEARTFIHTSRLFGDAMSCARQREIISAVSKEFCPKGAIINPSPVARLSLVRSGRIDLCVGKRVVEQLRAGDFFGESRVLFRIPCLYTARAAARTELYHIPGEVLENVPIIRWKLMEAYETRLDKSVTFEDMNNALGWLPEFATGHEGIDEDHKELFRKATALYKSLFDPGRNAHAEDLFGELLRITQTHFEAEEKLMRDFSFPALASHAERHRHILKTMSDFFAHYQRVGHTSQREISTFIKDSVMTHILSEDRKLGTYLKG